ncbi:MAG: hypothetical protein WAW37_13350 [Syntrophobacteraceae bacterium]
MQTNKQWVTLGKGLVFLVFLFGFAFIPAASHHVLAAGDLTKPVILAGVITFAESDGTFTMQASDGSVVLFYARKDTKISAGGKAAKVADVKAGATVQVVYIPQSKTAVEIQILP